MTTTKPEDVHEFVEEMTRWEDDGGGNVGAKYEWLPLTSNQTENVERTKNGGGPDDPRKPLSAKVAGATKLVL